MRSTAEWIGKTGDSTPPPRVRLRIFYRTGGNCGICTRQLVSGKWDCDHITPLILGGENRENNMQAVCVSPCHSDKTRGEVRQKSVEYRRRASDAGIKKRKRTIPGRRFDGTPIPSRWK